MVMSEQFEEFRGSVGLTFEESEPWWPLLPEHEHGPRPNVLIILFDDMGFAHLGCYGSTIDTPHIDKLADEGLRYSNFHVTPLCSPTRASLLTGRNHHAVGMRTISFHDTGFTNMRSAVSKHSATLAEMLRPRGYATYMVGKWHLSPAEENGPAGPYDHWPLQRGFDRYYGFLAGATDQFYPELTEDNRHITPPKRPEEGYHITEDLVDHAIQFIRDKQSHRPDQPFFTYLALGAVHEPHQSPASTSRSTAAASTPAGTKCAQNGTNVNWPAASSRPTRSWPTATRASNAGTTSPTTPGASRRGSSRPSEHSSTTPTPNSAGSSSTSKTRDSWTTRS